MFWIVSAIYDVLILGLLLWAHVSSMEHIQYRRKRLAREFSGYSHQLRYRSTALRADAECRHNHTMGA